MSSDEVEAMRLLFREAFAIEINMSDTFAYACADSETFDMADFELAAPVIAKYKGAALTAYAALKRGRAPISCRCGHDGPDYEAAKAELELLRAENPDFLEVA